MSSRAFILFLTVLSIPCGVVEAVAIPPEWVAFINRLISTTGFRTCNIIDPPSLASQMHSNPLDTYTSGAAIVLPHVLLWEPISQFTCFFPQGITCPTSGCLHVLSLVGWNTGTSAGHCPRLLHDIEHMVLLVPAVYKCAQGHQVLSTDAHILRCLHEQEHIPFILLHRSGMTRRFVRTVIRLAMEGMGFAAIERFFISRRLEYIASTRLKISSIFDVALGSVPQHLDSSIDNTFPLLQKPYPSNDLLCRCFIQDFLEHRSYYFQEMALQATSEYISIDHTFKVAANLGYVRPDGQWVSQYEATLIVLNNEGKIIAWQLTRTTAFDEVRPMLSALSERLSQVSSSPTTVTVDNCCTVRNKIQSVFGTETLVLLDLFHAVQRIIKHMPKRHPLYSLCKSDVSMLFRDPNDRGAKRQMKTPDPVILLLNLQQFTKKWEEVHVNGWYVLSTNVKDALDQLKVHISLGCLSGIPPGCGTNRNENLHKTINPFFSRCRMGIPLALALLTVLFHRHNQKISGDPKVQLPIFHARALSRGTSTDNTIRFGIIEKSYNNSTNESWIFGTHASGDTDDMSAISCTELRLPSCIADLVTINDIKNVLQKSLHTCNILQHLEKQAKSSFTKVMRMVPFMSAVTSNFVPNYVESDSEYALHQTRLSSVVKSCGYQLCQMEGDGNCCFSAIAFSLLTQQHLITAKVPTYFADKQMPVHGSLTELARFLRERTVEEWQSNWHEYQGFLTDSTVLEEAPKFLQDGYYHGELANSMIMATCNY